MFCIDKVLILKDVDSIYKSLSEILEINEITIRRFILRKSMFYRKLEDVSLEDFFTKVFGNKLEKEDLYNRIKFAYITVSHFASRLNGANDVENQPLYNLFDALTNDTGISLYMRENGFQFIKENNSILTFYKGEKVNWEDYFRVGVSKEIGNPQRIQVRLIRGYEGNDKCINGFLFGEYLNRNNYIKMVSLGCPEIISDICGVLNRTDMIKYIKDNSHNYVVTFKEKISNIMFMKDIHLDNYNKLLKIYKYVIFYLCKNFCNTWYENMDNQMLRLKDELNVPSENIIEAKKVEIEW